MAKPTRTSARSSPISSSTGSSGTPGKQRGGNPYGIGGTLVTLLLALLLWWFNNGQPMSTTPAVPTDSSPTSTITADITEPPPTAAAVVAEVATATAEPAATDEPTPTLVPPTATNAPPPTATAQPAPTATKPPKPTPSPTSKVSSSPPGIPTITDEELPPEALDTLALIASAGPFPFARDGITFQNRERLLPSKPRGYYREYTVITPGESDRGARRIIAGENGELYYTDDHYESFSWIVTQ